MQELTSATPALDSFRQFSVRRARHALDVLRDGGPAALAADVHGEPFGRGDTEGMNEAYAVGVLTHHLQALLASIGGEDAGEAGGGEVEEDEEDGEPALSDVLDAVNTLAGEVRSLVRWRITAEAIFNAGVETGKAEAR